MILGRTLKKYIVKLGFSDKMFGDVSATTAKTRQHNFGGEISHRCLAEFNGAFKKYGNDVEMLIEKLEPVPNAIVNCYRGNCTACDEVSFACNARGLWQKHFLKEKFTITPTADNVLLLIWAMKRRLGPDAIRKTRYNTKE